MSNAPEPKPAACQCGESPWVESDTLCPACQQEALSLLAGVTSGSWTPQIQATGQVIRKDGTVKE